MPELSSATPRRAWTSGPKRVSETIQAAVDDGLHVDGVGGAYAPAELAALAGECVDLSIRLGAAAHGREAADLGAAPAGGAGLGVDDRPGGGR